MFGMITKLLGGGVVGQVTELVQGFTGSQKDRDKQAHDEHAELMRAYANELAPKVSRNIIDSIVDALNRIVRPAFTFGTIYVFYYCISDPAGFSLAMQALALMPEYGWALFGTIIAFWFGGRFLNKDMAMRGVKPVDPNAVAQVIRAKTEHDERKAAREENMDAVRRKLRSEENGN